MWGGLKIEIVAQPTCLFVWKGFSAGKMGEDILSRHALPFMTYAASSVVREDFLVKKEERQKQPTQVRDVVQRVKNRIRDLRDFFKNDFSLMILKFRPISGDIRIIALQPRAPGENAWEANLRHMVASRCLALKERPWLLERGRSWDTTLAKAHGLGPTFLRSQGLEENNHNKRALYMGRLTQRIELESGHSGTSLIVIPVYPLVLNLRRDQEDELIQSLLDDAELVSLGQEFTSEMKDYHDLYEKLLDRFPQRGSGL